MRYALADHGIALGLDDLPEGHVRLEPYHVVHGLDVFTDLRELQPRVHEHGWNVGVDAPDEMEEDRAILPAAECDVDLALGCDVELLDLDRGVEDLVIEGEGLELAQVVPGGILSVVEALGCLCRRTSLPMGERAA